MDPVNHKALKGKFKDREDKDVDNDGDTDASDEYLHKRRTAVSKAIGKMKEERVKKKDDDEEEDYEDEDESEEDESEDESEDEDETPRKRRGVKKFSEVDEDWKKDSGWNNPAKVRKDKFGNVIKDKNAAKHLAKVALNKTKSQKDQKEEAVDVTAMRESTVSSVLNRMTEAKDAYTISHKTFSSAVQHAEDVVKKRGFEIDPDVWDRKVAMGPKKPGSGKTNSYTIELMKDGKETKKKLQMQVYYDEGRYELNMYIS